MGGTCTTVRVDGLFADLFTSEGRHYELNLTEVAAVADCTLLGGEYPSGCFLGEGAVPAGNIK